MGVGEMDDSPKSRWWCASEAFAKPSDRRNQYRFLFWMMAWMLVFALASLAIRGRLSGLGVELTGWSAWAAAILPNMFAAGALYSYLKFLRMADELTRLIQLQSLAVGFGMWFFLTLSWKQIESAGGRRYRTTWRFCCRLLPCRWGSFISAAGIYAEPFACVAGRAGMVAGGSGGAAGRIEADDQRN